MSFAQTSTGWSCEHSPSLAFAGPGYYSVLGLTNNLPAVHSDRQAVTVGRTVRPAEHTTSLREEVNAQAEFLSI